MSCLIHHFSYNVRSTHLIYSHFYYQHLFISYILYDSSLIFSFLSLVYFFHISILYIYIHVRCQKKFFLPFLFYTARGYFSREKKHKWFFKASAWFFYMLTMRAKSFNGLPSRFFRLQDIFRPQKNVCLQDMFLLFLLKYVQIFVQKIFLLFFFNLRLLLKARIPGLKRITPFSFQSSSPKLKKQSNKVWTKV